MKIEDFVTNFESSIEGIPPGTLTPETVFRDLPQWDSLGALTLLVMVNTEFGVTMTGNELKACSTIREIHDMISKKTA